MGKNQTITEAISLYRLESRKSNSASFFSPYKNYEVSGDSSRHLSQSRGPCITQKGGQRLPQSWPAAGKPESGTFARLAPCGFEFHAQAKTRPSHGSQTRRRVQKRGRRLRKLQRKRRLLP